MFTEIIDSLVEQMQGAEISNDLTEAQVIFEMANDIEGEIKALNTQIREFIEPKQLAIESKEVFDYNMKLTRIKVKANKLLGNATPNPSSPIPVKPENRVRLPELSLNSFDGKYEEWPSFIDSFNSAINSRDDISDVEKFSYLKGLLQGKAKKAIDGFTLTKENYKEALDTLKQRFGNDEMITNTLISKILQAKEVERSWDIEGLRTLCDVIDSSARSLKAIGFNTDIYAPIILPILPSKLPSDLALKWNLKATVGPDPLKEFTTMLESEIRAREKTNTAKQKFGKQANNNQAN